MKYPQIPKISIVSPSYNQGEFLEDAILSVLNQNYGNFEHIIIDGGSTDSTIDILKKYPHLIWISEKDEGQSDAINKGFSKANGDIIGWLNTDDYYLPNAFNIVVNAFENNKIDALYGDIQFVNRNKQFLRRIKSHKPVKWLSLFYCYIPSASFFFKKEILDAGIQIDKKMHICMDKDFFANIMYHNYKFLYISKVLTAFRWHENNKSIDSIEVKKIRRIEGLEIFSKYSLFNMPQTYLNIKLYSLLMFALLPIRKFLKMI